MKIYLTLLGLILIVLSCNSRRDLYYQQESQRIQDSLQQVRLQMKGDDDRDGVINYYDQCEKTPAKARVDHQGCPMDVDYDGVIDLYDKCVTVPGKKELDGCPEENN